jgi:transposase
MNTKKLSDGDVNLLQEMLLEGKTPEYASRHFKVAVSSIHNYKRELKERGIELPNVRGQRPKGIGAHTPDETGKESTEDYLYVTVENTSICIKNTAKSVIVDKNKITIVF